MESLFVSKGLGSRNDKVVLGEETKKVTGSVVEFAFGIGRNSYFATSYPHPAIHVDISDVRSME
jgi:hypothetical protein